MSIWTEPLGKTPPTPQQRLWGAMFEALWHLIDGNGRGAGKTWFWKHVIAFIELQDPEVLVEPKAPHWKSP